MMSRLWRSVMIALPLCLIFVSVAAAQPSTCQATVSQALDAVEQNCAGLGTNEACYGNFAIRADFQQEMPVTAFVRPSDTVELAMLNTLRASPLDLERNEWGVAVMNVQADVPATAPGQGVVFLLLGDVRLDDGSLQRDDRAPMQAFFFSAGIGAPNCQEAPSTVAIRSPEGITVNLTINGLDVTLGSLITLTDNQNGTLTVTVHEGQLAAVQTGTVIPAGQALDLTLDPTQNVSVVGTPRTAAPNELALAEPVSAVYAAVDGETIAEAPPVQTGTYIVQPGDNLFRIALDNGTCLSEITAANNIPVDQANTITVGQELIIPDGSTCEGQVGDVPNAPVNPPIVTDVPPAVVTEVPLEPTTTEPQVEPTEAQRQDQPQDTATEVPPQRTTPEATEDTPMQMPDSFTAPQ